MKCAVVFLALSVARVAVPAATRAPSVRIVMRILVFIAPVYRRMLLDASEHQIAEQ